MFRRKRDINLTPNYILLILLVAFAMGPLMVLCFNSLKSPAEIGRNPLGRPLNLSGKTTPMRGTSAIFPRRRATA